MHGSALNERSDQGSEARLTIQEVERMTPALYSGRAADVQAGSDRLPDLSAKDGRISALTLPLRQACWLGHSCTKGSDDFAELAPRGGRFAPMRKVRVAMITSRRNATNARKRENIAAMKSTVMTLDTLNGK